VNNPPPVTTISGAIRKRLTEIDQRMYEGQRQVDIVAQLNRDGIKVSLKDFRQLLYRARKARDKLDAKQRDSSSAQKIEIKEIQHQPEQVSKKPSKSERTETKKDIIERKPSGKMSVADLDNLLKNPLDLDNM
jgi:hypothetical protein